MDYFEWLAFSEQVSLPSWPHSRDSLTVWKRHTFCTIQYGEDDEGDDQEGQERQEGPDSQGNRTGEPNASTASEMSSETGEGLRVEGGDASEEDSGSSAGGFADLDMYAFVPADEQISSAQAAPCVRFLLET